jgi:hypothetical protein
MLTRWRSLSLCFLANFSASFVTISIWRSLWSSAFLIYQGASTMFLSTLFWIAEWCQCCSVSCIPTAVCRRSRQASIFVCTASAYCVSAGPIFFPWANTFFCMTLPLIVISIRWHSTHEWNEFFMLKCCTTKCEYRLEASAQTWNKYKLQNFHLSLELENWRKCHTVSKSLYNCVKSQLITLI